MSGQYNTANVALVQKLSPVSVLGDSARLRQVGTHLPATAVKYTPSGGEVEVVVGPCGPDSVELVEQTAARGSRRRRSITSSRDLARSQHNGRIGERRWSGHRGGDRPHP
jgi:hypothetical protein